MIVRIALEKNYFTVYLILKVVIESHQNCKEFGFNFSGGYGEYKEKANEKEALPRIIYIYHTLREKGEIPYR